jgi:hypothetical protein
MGNTAYTADPPVSRITLGAFDAVKSCAEFDTDEYYTISDTYRFHHIVCRLQPGVPKGIELHYDVDLFIHQGPTTGYVLSVFSKAFVVCRRRRYRRLCRQSSFVPPSLSLPPLSSSSPSLFV